MTQDEIIQAVRAIVDENIHPQHLTVPPALFDEYWNLCRAKGQPLMVDEKLAMAGYQNFIPGLFSYTIVRGQP